MEKQGREKVDPPTAMILGLLLPGAGHLYGGRFGKAAFFFAVINGTFLAGLVLSNFHAVSLSDQPYWFLGQVFTGIPAVIAAAAGPARETAEQGFGLDTGTLYTTVAGLLNILVILDAAFPLEWRILFNVDEESAEGPRDLLESIKVRSGTSGVLARFPSMQLALRALKALSFAGKEGENASFPENLQCGVFRTSGGAVVVIGGSLSNEQREEVMERFQPKARELTVVNDGQETHVRRPWWKP